MENFFILNIIFIIMSCGGGDLPEVNPTSELHLTDLNEGNIIFCTQENRDRFYVIDLGYSDRSDLAGKNLQAIVRTINWYQDELPENIGALNFIAERIWQF